MRPGTTSRRLLLGSALLLAAGAASAALMQARAEARLAEATSLLVAGEADEAGEILTGMADLPFYGARARAGLRIAAVLGADTGDSVDAPFDASRYPLAVLARQAFDDGRFAEALALADLAAANGRPTVAAVRAAALVEHGHEDAVAPAPAPSPVATLARRVDRYLEARADGGGVILRDRRGRHLGHLTADGAMTVAAHVPPELVPRAVAEAAAERRAAPSLRLSLDLELSALALDAFGRYRGSIVIVDPASGDILAAVSDERTFRDGGTPAFEERREPASIAKLMTTTAALRAGVDPDAELARMTCRGHQRFNGRFLYCPYVAGPLGGLDRALAVSCNVAFAEIGVRLGRRRMLQELRIWGFDAPAGRFPAGRIVQPRGDDRQLADLAIGLEATAITPLHAALLAAVMANDGVMPTPTLVHAEDARLGFHPRPLPVAPGRRVVEPEWLPQLLSAMAAVAKRGTASRLAPYNFPVAMKTGTASDPRWGFYVNYVGIGPKPAPRLAFCVRITHQRTSRRVRDAAREVTRRLLRQLGRFAEDRGWLDAAPPVASDRLARLDPESRPSAREWPTQRGGKPGDIRFQARESSIRRPGVIEKTGLEPKGGRAWSP